MKKQMKYKIGHPGEFSAAEIGAFLRLLIKQDKVHDPSAEKLSRCKLLAIAIDGTEVVAIGAVKPKTPSDFQTHKADLAALSKQYHWEIGYFFTEPAFEGRKISSSIVDSLLKICGSRNLMASTEVREGNRMINLLENRGFKKSGKTWTSTKSGEQLALYLREAGV